MCSSLLFDVSYLFLFYVLGSSSPNLWLKILRYLKQDPKEFIKFNEDSIQKMLINDFNSSPVCTLFLFSFILYFKISLNLWVQLLFQSSENCLRTLSGLCPEKILPPVIKYVRKHLSDPAILNVTKDEYFIYLTPEGELYDKSVIAG